MGFFAIVGHYLLGFGPAVALLLGFVSLRAQLLIITIISAFFWILSLLVSSLIWTIIPPLKDTASFTIPVAVVVQEAFRILFVFVYHRIESKIILATVGTSTTQLNDLSSAVAGGVGFGLAHSSIMYGVILSNSAHDAAVYFGSCTGITLALYSAVSAFLVNMLHTLLMIGMVDGIRRKSMLRVVGVVAIHMAYSCMSIAHDNSPGCTTVLLVQGALVLAALAWSTLVIRSSTYYARRQAAALRD